MGRMLQLSSFLGCRFSRVRSYRPARYDQLREELLSHLAIGRRLTHVNADSEPIAGVPVKSSLLFDFEAVFRAHYKRVARTITSVVRDPGRAEDLAVEVFWKLWINPRVNGPHVGSWLYRAAMRMGLDELRRQSRREKYERFFNLFRPVPLPDQVHEANEVRQRICTVLAAMKSRDAELLLLWTEGQTYEEIAEIIGMNPASVGTFLSRAQRAFRKEYTKRYGNA